MKPARFNIKQAKLFELLEEAKMERIIPFHCNLWESKKLNKLIESLILEILYWRAQELKK